MGDTSPGDTSPGDTSWGVDADDRQLSGRNEIRRALIAQRTELDRVAAAVAGMRSDAATSDRSISLTVNARGLLTDLHIDPAALRRYRADQLAAAIVDLVASADAKLCELRNRITSEAVETLGDYEALWR